MFGCDVASVGALTIDSIDNILIFNYKLIADTSKFD